MKSHEFTGTETRGTNDIQVSVIISIFSKNRFPDVKETIETLLNGDHSQFEIVVIVDEDEELYQEILNICPNEAHSPLKVFFNEHNYGLSYSRNYGIKKSSGRIAAFIDDDALPDTNWLSSIVESFSDDLVRAATGQILPYWEDEQDVWFPKELYWMISCCDVPDSDIFETERGFGANMAFRMSIFSKIGMFNEELGIRPGKWIGGEDSEMFMRIHQAGYRVLYNPGAVVFHKIPHSRLLNKNIRKRAFNQGYTIAKMSKFESYSSGEKTTEYSYLRSLCSDFYPKKLRNLNGLSLKQMVTTTIVVIFVGLGYMRGLLSWKKLQ